MDDLAAKNKKLLKITLGVVVGMVALAYASVPIYRITCQAFGWGGTTQMVKVNPNINTPVSGPDFAVRFDSNVAPNLPWSFKPDVHEIKVKAGADAFISFIAENTSDKAVVGTAVYNVAPLKAGKYFYKTQCFCFGEQVLEPKQKVHMPVVFFIDPKIMDDPEMNDVRSITLSYTFFKKDSQELEKAMEKFYNEPTN